MARILLAGGAGFIGSHLVDLLLARGDEVVVVDDLSTGTAVNARRHEAHPAFRFVRADVVDDDLGELVGRGAPFTAVMHLASAASPPAYLAHPIETLDAGSAGTRNLLEIARRDGARFLLASTSEVYGDPLEHPQTESYWGNVNPIGERSVYDEAKRFAEAMTMAYARTFGLDVRIARIFNTYGPRMRADDGRVVTNFVHRALAGESLEMYGDGTQTRSFCYVSDEAAGLLALLDGDTVGPINIGNPVEFTMIELAELAIELTGSTSSVVYLAAREDDPQLRRPDISLARSVLGWEPRVPLREGLERMIADIRADAGENQR